MVIRLLDKGTLFDVTVLGDNPDTEIKMKGALYDTERNIILLMEGVDLFEYCSTQPTDLRFSLLFYKGSKEYSFHGKLLRTFMKHGVNLVEIEATSGIEEKNRRSAIRMELSLPVKLYAQTEHNTKELMCSGSTVDVSFDSICFLSNDKLTVPDTSKFYVEFSVLKDRFLLLGKLVRKGNSPQSYQFKHDYALAFDFSETPEEKNRLITSFFKSSIEKMNHR